MIGERLLNSDKFLLKAKEKFGDKYDYSDVEYSRMRDKVLIKCTTHKFSFFCKDHGIKLLRISYQEDVEHKIIKNL